MSIADHRSDTRFRFRMLIHDQRYRAVTIQILFFLAIVALAGWLVSNAAANLAKLGIKPSFDFLWNRAGYDISMKLIHYTNDSTHARAALVGLVNTLFVSVLGCVTATIIGVIVGVLRLSKNWVIARLMTVYIEVVRNVPLLLWLLVLFAVFTEATPAPSQFRGDNPTAHMWLWDSVAVTNRYVALPSPVFYRSLGDANLVIFNVSLDLMALIAVIIGGVLVHRAYLRRATRVQEATSVRPPGGRRWSSSSRRRSRCWSRWAFTSTTRRSRASISRAASWRPISSLRCGSGCRSIPRPTSPKSFARAFRLCRTGRPRPPMRWACGPGAP